MLYNKPQYTDTPHLLGNYYNEIEKALASASQSESEVHVDDSLFFCESATLTPFLKYCTGACIDAGTGNSDYCVD
jgi:hypothetical protein